MSSVRSADGRMKWCVYDACVNRPEHNGFCAEHGGRPVRSRVLWVPKDGHKWFFIVQPYPQWDSDEWIEYVPKPEPRMVDYLGDLWWCVFDDENGWYITRLTNRGARANCT